MDALKKVMASSTISSSSLFAIFGAGPWNSVLSGMIGIPHAISKVLSSQNFEWYDTKVVAAE